MAGPSFNDRLTSFEEVDNIRRNQAYMRDAATFLRAVTDPSDRTRGRGHHLATIEEVHQQHLTEVCTICRDLPHPKHLRDNVMPRLLNDSYIAMLRRGTHLDIARLGQTSTAMQEAVVVYRSHWLIAWVRATVKEYHHTVLPRLHAMPNELSCAKLWVSGSIANGGILKCVLSAWQALAETWRTTTCGVQEKWESMQNSEEIPANIKPSTLTNIPTVTYIEGRPPQRVANWTLDQARARRHERWLLACPGLATMHRVVAQWKWLVSTARQSNIFIDLARERARDLLSRNKRKYKWVAPQDTTISLKPIEGAEVRPVRTSTFGNSIRTIMMCRVHRLHDRGTVLPRVARTLLVSFHLSSVAILAQVPPLGLVVPLPGRGGGLECRPSPWPGSSAARAPRPTAGRLLPFIYSLASTLLYLSLLLFFPLRLLFVYPWDLEVLFLGGCHGPQV
ncbi:unnamed protein product [Polarella glacialis]|uniref:Uncharacterized protein n=1 Tax=Polarella glacialis TaxID=89957 RepID=A0A813HYK0_POLGL|nr:unnamed protein product [Polarella glacialis]